MDRVLENSVEKQGQFGRRLVRILFGKLEHRVLDDVQRRFLVADGEFRVFEGAALDFGEERRHFLLR
jgi:hypothetical protein